VEQGIQTFFGEVGEAACYALDIVQIAIEETGRAIEPVTALNIGINRRDIYYNRSDANDNRNFFVERPDEFLGRLTGDRWTVEHVGPAYIGKPGERIVERWERIKTGAVISHFRLPHWDSVQGSQTVAHGSLVSKRVFRKA
jgi:hypothetical protein